MALFNGINIFGVHSTIRAGGRTVARQLNSFAGISGVESLFAGTRGQPITVAGRHVGVDAADLADQQGLFESFKDGNTYILVDNLGVEYDNVTLEVFRPSAPFDLTADGYVMQEYEAEFFQLL